MESETADDHHLGATYHTDAYHWNGPRCPELVAGSRKQVEVVMMATDVHGNLSRMGHVTGRAAHPVTPRLTLIENPTLLLPLLAHK